MALIVSEFLGIIGVSSVPPTNMAELIPYLLVVFVGLYLVSAVFGVIGRILEFFFILRFRS